METWKVVCQIANGWVLSGSLFFHCVAFSMKIFLKKYILSSIENVPKKDLSESLTEKKKIYLSDM